MKHLFSQVDVFTDVPLRGNPVAVVHDADGLSDEQMQALARWTQLSETTFLLAPTSPDADYRLRIFTPGSELPFAGHPTLGSCHAWLERGGVPASKGQLVQECGVGRVTIRLDGERAAFAAPDLRSRPVEEGLLAEVVKALGLAQGNVRASRWLDNGPKWLGLLLDDAATVLAIEPDHAALKHLANVGVAGPYPNGAECAFEVRGFASQIGIAEDPVTGSLNASLAQWLIGEGLAPERYVVSQGTRLDRSGRVHIARKGDTVWVGGSSISVVRGEVTLRPPVGHVVVTAAVQAAV